MILWKAFAILYWLVLPASAAVVGTQLLPFWPQGLTGLLLSAFAGFLVIMASRRIALVYYTRKVRILSARLEAIEDYIRANKDQP